MENTDVISVRECSLWWLPECFENEITDYLKSIIDLNILDKFVSRAKENTDQHAIHLYDTIDSINDVSKAEKDKYVWVIRYPGLTVGHLLLDKNVITDIVIYEEPDIKHLIFKKDGLEKLKEYIGRTIDTSHTEGGFNYVETI